jgi:hypothetical protein
MRVLASAFLIGHGLVHGIMWALTHSEEALADLPMDPSHSWLLGDVRACSLGFALVTTVAFVVAAASFLADAGWWPWAAIVASALSVVLLGLFFIPWWGFGFAIDAAILFAAWRALTA